MMGDRVLVVCHDVDYAAPAIYAHWHGHDAPERLVEAGKAGIIRRDDPTYAAARILGFFHEDNPRSTTGLGIYEGPENVSRAAFASLSHGDAGVIAVNVATGALTYHGGYLADRENLPREVELSQ